MQQVLVWAGAMGRCERLAGGWESAPHARISCDMSDALADLLLQMDCKNGPMSFSEPGRRWKESWQTALTRATCSEGSESPVLL